MNVLALRKKFNLTKEDLASMLGVSSMAIYRWEKGKVKMRLIALKGLERIKQELERKRKQKK